MLIPATNPVMDINQVEGLKNSKREKGKKSANTNRTNNMIIGRLRGFFS